MLILHLSQTPLVGAPGRICRALNLHDDVEARWGVLHTDIGQYNKLTFDLDLTWADNREQLLDLIDRCDILHLHNTIDLNCSDFQPIDFRQLWNDGKVIVRHFHSTPELISKVSNSSISEVFSCPLPKLVIAQYPERFYSNSVLVPNIVFPIVGGVNRTTEAPFRIGYAPSRFNTGRSSRWDTKGYQETISLLKNVKKRAGKTSLKLDVDIIEQVSHATCLQRKANCDLLIDDLVTGSYHLNTLESLVQGVACMSYLDKRTSEVVRSICGREDFPVINVGMEHADEFILELVGDRKLTCEIGLHSKAWMDEFWNPSRMAEHFLHAYQIVSAAPKESFQTRIENNDVSTWSTIRFHDVEWRARQRNWPAVMPDWLRRWKGNVGALLRKTGLR